MVPGPAVCRFDGLAGRGGRRLGRLALDLQAGDQDRQGRLDKAEQAPVGGLESLGHRLRRVRFHLQQGVGAIIFEEDPCADLAGRRPLGFQIRPHLVGEIVGQAVDPVHAVGVQAMVEPGLAQGAHPGLADAPGGQQAGVAGAEHLGHAEGLGHPAGDLAGRAAKGHQGVAPGIKAALGGDAPHRLGGLLNGHGDKAFGGRLRAGRAHGLGQGCDPSPSGAGVQGLVLAGAEHGGKGAGVQPAQNDLRVRDGGRTAPAIGGGTGIGAGAARADPGAQAVEGQDRAAARGHGLHVQHRAAQAHASHLGRVAPLQGAGIAADIGGGAAHVEAERGLGARGLSGARHPDHAAGRPGDHGVAAAKGFSADQAAGRGHEIERGAVHRRGHAAGIGLQGRGQIGVGHGGLCARQKARQGGDLM